MRCVVPTLLAFELTNALRYKTDLSTDQIQQAVQSLFDMALEWISPSSAMICRAVEIARNHEATVYDAAFAALAESISATFVTADGPLVHRLEAFPCMRFLGELHE